MRTFKWLTAALAAAVLFAVPGEAETDSAQAGETVRLPIVMYHDITKNEKSCGPYVVSLAEFEADLRWLRGHGYETVSVQNLLDWEAGTFTMPEKPCMITLDDGACSTAAYAEPLLAQYGFCGVSAVIGAVCEEFSANGEQDAELSNLSWEAVREMAERGTIEVVCHSWNMHAQWPRKGCSRKKGESDGEYRHALSEDLGRFLGACEAHGVALSPAIAWPYGAYSRASTQTARDLGALAAFTCDETVNTLTHADGELLHLGRFNRPHGAAGEKIFQIWEETS